MEPISLGGGESLVIPELCMFLDESIKRSPSATVLRLVVGCVVVEARRWRTVHTEARRVRRMGGKKQVQAIADILGRVGGFALITYADLPTGLVPPEETDMADDIPVMTRADNVWSQAVLTTAAAMLACLRSGGVAAAVIDLFYDPKSLTTPHRSAFEGVLQKTLPDIAREDPETHEIRTKPGLVFRRLEQVRKKRDNIEADLLENGTDMADRLCSRADELIRGRVVPRIVVRDHTDVLRGMITRFSGG